MSLIKCNECGKEISDKSKEIKVVNGVIPYEEIKDNKDITFIVITPDEEVLTKSLEAITNVHDENKDKNFNIIISSSYEKLHRISNGML